MNQTLLALARTIVWCSLVLIAVVTIHDHVQTKIDMHTYEEMAKRDGCVFLTPSASRRDVGMFQCDHKIVFKKLED